MNTDIPQALQPDLPATPMSILLLSETFDRYGYYKLARHLRNAADALSAKGAMDVHAVLEAARYEHHVEGSRYGVTLRGCDASVHDVVLGQRYALVPLPPESPDHAQLGLPVSLSDAADALIRPSKEG